MFLRSSISILDTFIQCRCLEINNEKRNHIPSEGKFQAKLIAQAAVGLNATQDFEVLRTDSNSDDELNRTKPDENLPGITELNI